jgi:hypothetical protein
MVRSHFLETSVAVFLPATGDYDIGVMRKSVVTGDCENPAPTNYTLEIEIPPLQPPEPTAVATPTRIIFSPGETSATIEGRLTACGDGDSYTLEASKGQTMQITVTSPDDDAIVTVTRHLPDGTWDPMVRSHFLETSVAVFLPATGDYDIDVMRKSVVMGNCEEIGLTSVNYVLTIEIPPLPSP